MSTRLTTAEDLFARYLREQGYAGWEEREPDLAVGPTKPDFLIERHGVQVVCEVKEFETQFKTKDLLASDTGTASWSARQTLGPVRRSLKAAARQLKPYSDQGKPLVVVLGNPRHADVDLDPYEVLHAMYGDPVVPLRTGTDGKPTGEMTVGRNGELTNSHQYLSAVVCLRWNTRANDWWQNCDPNEAFRRQLLLGLGRPYAEPPDAPVGDYVAVDVIDTRAALTGLALPLRADFFNGPDDRKWSAVGDHYEQTR